LPSIGSFEFARAGGLISYWYDPVELHAQAASYIDRILRGASPADMPVQQPTKYSLIINLKTAKRSASLCRRTCSSWPMR
jgi:putative ABC transport system substrate-binding protein